MFKGRYLLISSSANQRSIGHYSVVSIQFRASSAPKPGPFDEMIQVQSLAEPNGIGGLNHGQVQENGMTTEPYPAPSASPQAEVGAPVVFQCVGCKSIVGDTSSIACMDPARRTMSIRRKVDMIDIEPALHTSTDEFDFGSTFQHFYCVACKIVVGRVYRTTSAKLDHLRELFTYDSNQLSLYSHIFVTSRFLFFSYQLCPDLDFIAGFPATQTVGEEALKEDTYGPAANNAPAALCLPTVTNTASIQMDDMQVEIVKLQKFCLYLLEKIQNLENDQRKLKRSHS